MTKSANDSPIVFYDGTCRLCNGGIQFILKRELDRRLRFTSLQSEIGASILKDHDFPIEHFNTMVFIENGKLHTKSSAVLNICKFLKFPWNWFRLFLIVPKFLRDAVYMLISSNRYRWFGKTESCMAPRADFYERFLDWDEMHSEAK